LRALRVFIERLVGRRIFKFDEKPYFRFYPECYNDGTLKQSNQMCLVCGAHSNWMYTGNIYSICNDAPVCSACIAEDSLRKRFGDSFTFFDIEFSDEVDRIVEAEILQLTPGFPMFNPITWPVRKGTPLVYLGIGDEERFWKDEACRLAMQRFWHIEIGEELVEPTSYILIFRTLDGSEFGFALDFD
jgi:uncharacterized protein CbrC (UPF0167 family)